MIDILVEPSVLACPNPADFEGAEVREAVLRYLSRLADFSDLRRNLPGIVFWRAEDLARLLAEKNCYPFRHSLSNAFAALHESTNFQVEDINRLAVSLLERSVSLEEHGLIRDIVLSNCVIDNDPMENRPQEWVDHICRCVALALPELGAGEEFRENTFIASSSSDHHNGNLRVRYVTDLIEFKDDTYQDLATASSVEMRNCPTPSTFLRILSLTKLCVNEAPRAFEDACAIGAAVETGESWDSFLILRNRLTTGSAFVQSARVLGFLHTPQRVNRLLRVCADLLYDRNLGHSHWLRVSEGPNDAQRTRGDWKAWRHDIDYEYHLHYWRLGDRIELGNVVVHNDFEITR